MVMAGVFPAIDIFEQISQMLRRIVSILVVVPLAIVIVAFAVANRQSVTVSFDPFSSANPAYATTIPLFVLIFALLILGVLVGGVAAWFRQGRWRRTARRLEGEVRTLHQEMDGIRRRFAPEPPATTAEAASHKAIPPPIP
jgi:uncharacterized integral membrane protein